MPRTFMKTICSNSDVSNDVGLDKKIMVVTKSRGGHPPNN